MSDTKKSNKEQSFEASLKRLEQIVSKLEDGDQELEKSLELFEEGVAMAKNCQKKLDEAEKKIAKLVRDKDGKLGEEPMDDLENGS